MKKAAFLFLIPILFLTQNVFGEYRAFLIEVYDHIQKKQWEERTGFSPQKYMVAHGGGNRLSVVMKATWMCYGDTSQYIPVCPMPKPRNPKFKVGDRVKINLEKHITQDWVGVIELAWYQAHVKSNVYGVRFGDKRKLYNRYFEFDLEKQAPPKPKPVEEEKK